MDSFDNNERGRRGASRPPVQETQEEKPIFPDMTDADVHRVVEEIKGALSHCLS